METPKSKVPCWCTGRKGKEHTVGDPFCMFPGTYIPPSNQIESKTGSNGVAGRSEAATISADSNLREEPQIVNLTKSPITFDEELLMSCVNRAILKDPYSFVPLLEEGRFNHLHARLVNNELRTMGYCITEDPL